MLFGWFAIFDVSTAALASGAKEQDACLLKCATALRDAPPAAGLPKVLAALSAPHSYAIAAWLLEGLRAAPTPQVTSPDLPPSPP